MKKIWGYGLTVIGLLWVMGIAFPVSNKGESTGLELMMLLIVCFIFIFLLFAGFIEKGAKKGAKKEADFIISLDKNPDLQEEFVKENYPYLLKYLLKDKKTVEEVWFIERTFVLLYFFNFFYKNI